MKYFLGFIITIVLLFISAYFLLGVWGVDIISKENLNKSLISLGIVSSTIFVLIVFVFIPFFKSNNKGYDNNQKGIVQKKIE